RQAKQTLLGHQEPAGLVLFSADGKQIISNGNDETIRIWEVASGRELRSWKPHRQITTALSLAPDGRRLFSGCLDGSVKCWDVTTGQQEGEELRFPHAVFTLGLSADGKSLVAAGRDGEVRVIDAQTHRPRTTYRGHVGGVYSARFLRQGCLLVSSGE